MNDSNEGDHKIIPMPSLAERDKLRREKEKMMTKKTSHPPVFNIPPFTKYLLGLILGMYFITGVILEPRAADFVYDHFGLVPEKFWTDAFDVYTIISPFTHILLHGSWMHVIMNVFMLAAFGSGVERWLGFKHTMILFIASAFFGAALHFVLNTSSPFPMIGASGGISGLFAAAIVMMNKGGQEMGGKIGILPFALVWIGLSIGFGMLGGPDGSIIAWAAHVGGFLGGFAVLKLMKI